MPDLKFSADGYASDVTMWSKATDRPADRPADQPTDSPRVNKLIELMLSHLDAMKAEDIAFINIADKSSVADGIIICCGNSHRHVGAIANDAIMALKKDDQTIPRVEGVDYCDWVLIDAGAIVIHIFRPEVREFYKLEKLWSN